MCLCSVCECGTTTRGTTIHGPHFLGAFTLLELVPGGSAVVARQGRRPEARPLARELLLQTGRAGLWWEISQVPSPVCGSSKFSQDAGGPFSPWRSFSIPTQANLLR